MTEWTELAEVSHVVSTDAGMCALWDPAQFGDVVDYDSWQAKLLRDEDITRHIQAGALVPLNLGFDGVFGVTVRVGTPSRPATLSARENRYLAFDSDPYLFVSTGAGWVGGLEQVSATGDANVAKVQIPPGRRTVTVHLVDWEAEPGARDDDGKPTPDALSDFVVLVNPGDRQPAGAPYRTKIETFDQPQ